MKKISVFIILLLFIAYYLLPIRQKYIQKSFPIPDVAALSPCPVGITFSHMIYQIVGQSVYAPPYATYKVYISGFYGGDAGGPALISYGDGLVDTITLNPSPFGAHTYIPHAFNQSGDFYGYLVLTGDLGGGVMGWKYICYASALPVYYRYNSWTATTVDAGSSIATFNANDAGVNMGSEDRNDNIIGALEGTLSTPQGRGGNRYGTPDDNPILSISTNLGKWMDINYLGGDADISDGNTDWNDGVVYGETARWFDQSDDPLVAPSLGLRGSQISLTTTRPQKAYKYYGTPSEQITSNTYAQGDVNGMSVLWRPRVVSQPNTPTPPGSATPNISDPPIPPNSWVFPAQVINSADKTRGTAARGINGVTLELYGSNDPWVAPPWTDPARGPDVSKFIDKLDDCSSVTYGGPLNEPGYCLLSTVQYYGWYLIKIINDQYEAESTSCTFNHTTRLPTALNICASMDNSNIRRGWFSDVSMGTYGGDVFYADLAPTVTPSPTPTTAVVPWFQVKGGNAYANKDIFSSVPAGNAFNTNVTNTASEGTSYFGESFTPGFSEPVRNAHSGSFPVAELVDYEALYSRFGVSASTLIDGSDITKSGVSGQGSTGNTKVYYRNGDLTLSSDWINFTGNVVIFVKGDLTINTNVTVDQGSFLGFVVNKDITIDPAVTQVQGFYFTDKTINTGSSDTQLTLSGTFVARDGFSLQRDLADDTLPAEVFEYRPDFSFTAPNELRRPYRNWEEVAP